jgi:hypothetical protein
MGGGDERHGDAPAIAAFIEECALGRQVAIGNLRHLEELGIVSRVESGAKAGTLHARADARAPPQSPDDEQHQNTGGLRSDAPRGILDS